jgi:hypothetical protein
VIFTLKTERNFNMGLGWAILGAAVVGAGASVYSSSKASKAAKSASNVQAESSEAAIAEQRRQFDAMRELLRPYIEAGNPELTKPFASVGPVALQQIQRLSGLSGESIRQQNLNLAFESAGYKKIASSALSEINDYQSKRDAARKSIKDPISLERFDSETNAVVQAIQDKAFAKQQEFVRPIVENKDYDKINVEQQRQAISRLSRGRFTKNSLNRARKRFLQQRQLPAGAVLRARKAHSHGTAHSFLTNLSSNSMDALAG